MQWNTESANSFWKIGNLEKSCIYSIYSIVYVFKFFPKIFPISKITSLKNNTEHIEVQLKKYFSISNDVLQIVACKKNITS